MTSNRRQLFQDLFDRYDRMAMAVYQRTQAQAKNDGTAVTALDIDASAMVLGALQAAFPEDGLVSEEEAEIHRPQAPRQWIVDPLDGTSSFARGYPIWGLGIARVDGGSAVEGYMRFPVLGDTFMHFDGASRYNEGPLPKAPQAPIRDTRNALIGSRALRTLPIARLKGFKLRNLGSNLYHMASLAAGRADAVISEQAYVWDLAPAMPFLRSAGHVMRYTSGAELNLADLADLRAKTELPIVMGTPEVVATILDML